MALIFLILGYSSGQAQAAIEKILAETLPNGMTYEWTELVTLNLISIDYDDALLMGFRL